MGLVVDMTRSGIDFSDPLLLTDYNMDGIHNVFDYELFSFGIKFGIAFDPDPKKGIGGSPNDAELWRVGIVQNILYERLTFEYENTPVFEAEFKSPAVDVVPGTFDSPFYAGPVFGKNTRNTRPVSNMWYTSQGYGELLNPYNASGVQTNNKPELLDMWDEPQGGAYVRHPKSGGVLRRMEKIVSFQTWLVARTPNTVVLAHVPAFSLMFWLKTDAKFKPKLSFDTPKFEYGMYGKKGVFSAKIDYGIKKIGPSPDVRVALGNGGRNPLMLGPPGLERVTKWLAQSGLHL